MTVLFLLVSKYTYDFFMIYILINTVRQEQKDCFFTCAPPNDASIGLVKCKALTTIVAGHCELDCPQADIVKQSLICGAKTNRLPRH